MNTPSGENVGEFNIKSRLHTLTSLLERVNYERVHHRTETKYSTRC